MKIKFKKGIDVALYIEGELVAILSSHTRSHEQFTEVDRIILNTFRDAKDMQVEPLRIRFNEGTRIEMDAYYPHSGTIYDESKQDPERYYYIFELVPTSSI